MSSFSCLLFAHSSFVSSRRRIVDSLNVPWICRRFLSAVVRLIPCGICAIRSESWSVSSVTFLASACVGHVHVYLLIFYQLRSFCLHIIFRLIAAPLRCLRGFLLDMIDERHSDFLRFTHTRVVHKL